MWRACVCEAVRLITSRIAFHRVRHQSVCRSSSLSVHECAHAYAHTHATGISSASACWALWTSWCTRRLSSRALVGYRNRWQCVGGVPRAPKHRRQRPAASHGRLRMIPQSLSALGLSLHRSSATRGRDGGVPCAALLGAWIVVLRATRELHIDAAVCPALSRYRRRRRVSPSARAIFLAQHGHTWRLANCASRHFPRTGNCQ